MEVSHSELHVRASAPDLFSGAAAAGGSPENRAGADNDQQHALLLPQACCYCVLLLLILCTVTCTRLGAVGHAVQASDTQCRPRVSCFTGAAHPRQNSRDSRHAAQASGLLQHSRCLLLTLCSGVVHPSNAAGLVLPEMPHPWSTSLPYPCLFGYRLSGIRGTGDYPDSTCMRSPCVDKHSQTHTPPTPAPMLSVSVSL